MGKMKRRLTYPFLSIQREIKKAHVPLIALMSLHFYLALQLFPLTWKAYCVTNLTLPMLEAASHFTNLIWGDFTEFSKMVKKLVQPHHRIYFSPKTCFFSLLLISKSLLSSSASHFLSHPPWNLLANPVGSILNLIISFQSHFFNSSTRNLFLLLLDFASQSGAESSESCCCPSERYKTI